MKNGKLIAGLLGGAAIAGGAALLRRDGSKSLRKLRRRAGALLSAETKQRIRRQLPFTLTTGSETARCRARLAPYCVGYGVDLGFGGEPITPTALRMDMPQPYTQAGSLAVQLGGTAEDLYWFRDGVLDYVYSSHLLEDYNDVEAVLREWLRVLKPGGMLVTFCPDEQVYRKHCAATDQPYNPMHKHTDFSLAYVKAILERIGGTETVHEIPLIDDYSWDLVVRKTS